MSRSPHPPRVPGVRRVFRLPWRTARAVDADVDEELRFHLDMRAAELAVRRGLDPASARAEALRQFGDLDDARRYIRAMDRRTETATRRRDLMDDLRQDLAHALRTLRRSPGFTAVAVLALALGIGATTSIFTLVNAVLLRTLPVAHPEQLVGLGDPTLTGSVSSGFPRADIFSYPLYLDLRDGNRLVSGLFASGRGDRLDVFVRDSAGQSAGAGAEPEHPRGRLVSGNYFAVLGVPAFAGRTFTADDDRGPGTGPVAVISHAYWTRRFGGDRAAIGRTLVVNRTPLTIIGVTPPGFFGEIVGSSTDVWIPLTMQPLLMPNRDWLRDRNTNWLMLMGRLAPGVTVAQAEAGFTVLARQAITAAGTAGDPDAVALAVRRASVEAYPGGKGFSRLREEFRGPLTILMAATGLVLLIVCANVANLMLARAAARRTEIGVRLALGAGRGRLVRQLLTESVVLGAAAGALGLAFAWWGSTLLLRLASPVDTPIPLDVRLDLRVLGFTAALSLVTAVLFGLVPAARATKVDLATTLRSHARAVSGGLLGGAGRRLGLGKVLVVGQVALSLVLLVGAGLLVRSAGNLQGADVGLARDRLLIVDVDARSAGYEGERLAALCDRLAERLRQLPGVVDVTYSENGIFSGTESATTLQVDGFVARTEDDTTVNTDRVGPGYFRAIGARLLRGRDIEPRDDARASDVAVINETMARFYFSGRDPIGQRIRVDSSTIQIVGVVADIRDHSLREEVTRRFYMPLQQSTRSLTGSVSFELRTAGDPAHVAAAARREVLATDNLLRVFDAQPLTALMRRSIAHERLVARLASVAGALALVLAALGLYGVMTYTIVRRTSEFGLRMALGARPWDVTRMVLRETITLYLVGALIGVPAALGAVQLIEHQLVGVGLIDLPTLAVSLAVLGASAALAGYRPASRAARVAPQVALRQE